MPPGGRGAGPPAVKTAGRDNGAEIEPATAARVDVSRPALVIRPPPLNVEAAERGLACRSVVREPDASFPMGGPRSLRAPYQRATVRQSGRRARRFRAVHCAMCSTCLFSLRLLALQLASAREAIVLLT